VSIEQWIHAGALAIVVVLACGAERARAATVGVTGGTLRYVAAAGETNEVKVERSGSAYVLTPVVAPGPALIVSAPCTSLGGGAAACPVSQVTAMDFDLGDGADQLLATAYVEFDAARVLVPVHADGGAGDDTLAGGFADDQLEGGTGDDTLTKGATNSVAVTLTDDGDVFAGEAGFDTVAYASFGPVVVTLDGVANDGRAGSHDQVGNDIEHVIGSWEADRITGSSRPETLEGGLAADTVDGGGGDDVLDGYYLNSSGGGFGGDTLNGGGGADKLSNAFRQHGGSGDDLLRQSGDDTADGFLHGDGGDDTLLPAGYGSGADVISGDDGIDTVDYAQDWNGVTVILDGVANDPGNDNVSAEKLLGGTGSDRLTGGPGANTLEGRDGDDVLDGGGATDAYAGGPGRDVVSYASHTATVEVTFDGVGNDGAPGEQENVSDGADIEGAGGGAGADTLTAGGLPVRLSGGAGDDTITGSPGQDFLEGNEGDDELAGLAEFDGLNGGSGADRVDGGVGNDWVLGGADDDEVYGGAGADVVAGNSGDDLLDGGADDSPDSLYGGDWPPDPSGADDGLDVGDFSSRAQPLDVTLPMFEHFSFAVAGDSLLSVEGILGGAGADVLIGNRQENVLDGGPGADRVAGREGADLLEGGAGADELGGDLGDDYLRGGPGDDSLEGGIDDDIIEGGDGIDIATYARQSGPMLLALDGLANDGAADEFDHLGPGGDVENIIGSTGDDLLVGDNAANVLSGGPGADVLAGLEGPDDLIGDAGFDAAAYVERTDPVQLADDGSAGSGNAQDGPPGARDRISPDVEDLWGGDGADRLTGNAAENVLNGGPGPDVLTGGPGEDAADWSDRDEAILAMIDGSPRSGGASDGPPGARDTVATDIEALVGGAGPDQLGGSAASNFLLGLGGDDHIVTRDAGADVAACDEGHDTAVADRADETVACEVVELPALPSGSLPGLSPQQAPPPAGTSATPAPPVMSVPGGQSLEQVLSRGLRTVVSCATSCVVAQTLSTARRAVGVGAGSSAKMTVIARANARRTGPGTVKVTLRLARKTARKLAALRRLTVKLSSTTRLASGTWTTQKKTLVLRGRKRAKSGLVVRLERMRTSAANARSRLERVR
jgi:Ca2+-binding RTX toxin-like protein